MATTPRPRRASSPPNRVDPGWLHEALADGILKLAKSSVDKATPPGVEFVAGDLKEMEEVIPESGREPVDLLARIIAHIAYRLPGVKNIEKRLEGKDIKSGFASDLLAFASQLFARNKHLLPVIVEAARTAQREAAAQKAAAKSTTTEGE